MKKKRHTPEQIIKKIRAIEVMVGQGRTVAEASKVESISEQSYYRWKKQYAGMNERSLKQFKGLERENVQLKKLLAEQALDLRILKEVAEGNWYARLATDKRSIKYRRIWTFLSTGHAMRWGSVDRRSGIKRDCRRRTRPWCRCFIFL